MALRAQDWMKIGGVRDFDQPMVEQPLGNPNFVFANQMSAAAGGASLNCNPPPPTFSHALASQLERQMVEADRFIALQNDKLIQTLQQQRKEQLMSLIRRLESTASTLLQQKEADILKASRRAVELQGCLRKAQVESETWQRIARESEAMVLALNNALEQLRESVRCSSSAGDDESCCYSSWQALGSSHRRKGREDIDEKIVCKACNSRPSCVLVLPCRHLSCCKSCENDLDLCPVCKSAKKACIEVFV